jgi:hypothetical protein
MPLCTSAYIKNIQKSLVTEDFWLCLKPHNWEKYIIFNVATNSDSGVKTINDVSALEPRCEIFIDDRYLFGLLTRLYHWNNAEIGSQYLTKRVPDVYNREVFSFLNKFHV